MAISRGLREILGVFGPMLDAALEFGRGSGAMWAALNDAYQAAGVERPRYATLSDMNVFRQQLGGYVQSVGQLGGAADETILGPQLWATPIGYEGTAKDFAAPNMLATFEAQIQTGEGVVTRWSSISYTRFFPSTVGELRSDAFGAVQEQLDIAAQEEGEESPTAGGLVVGLGRMYLVARGL